MRNEFAEMFQPVLRGACSLSRDGKQIRARSNGGMNGKKRKKAREEEGHSSTGDRESCSQKRTSPKQGMALR
jgi:hypothetical protein